MSYAIEPAYSVDLPGGTRFCASDMEVTELLRQYMAARPDDPLLKRVKIYKYVEDPGSAGRPLRLDLFTPEPVEEPTAPASIGTTPSHVAPVPAVRSPTPKPAPETHTGRAPVDRSPLGEEELFEVMLAVLRDDSAPRHDRIQAATSLAERAVGNPEIRAELERIRARLHRQGTREPAA